MPAMFGCDERREQLGLALEAREPLGILRELGGQRLDGDVAAEARVARAIDLAHAARAERRDDFVGAESGAGGEWHPGNLHHWRFRSTPRVTSRRAPCVRRIQ